MCDYSLYSIENRLAEDGEQLILHRFQTGTLGFASKCDLLNTEPADATSHSFWATVKDWMLPARRPRFPAICIPPGARLLLSELPRKLQRSLHVGVSEVVTFTEISDESYRYRDALLLPDGTRVLLQDLPEGIHATVLSMSSSEPSIIPVSSEVRVA